MAYFKIVAVIKRKTVEYCFVPQAWEDEGILFWPKANFKNLQKNAGSKPQSDWLQYKCKVKKSHIFGLEEAELWEEEFLKANTDAEDSLTINPPHDIQKSQNAENNNEIDELFITINSTDDSSIPSSMPFQVICTGAGPPKPTYSESFEPTCSADEDPISIPNEDLYTLLGSNDKVIEDDNSQALLREIIENQKKIFENHQRLEERIHSEFLQMRATNDAIYKLLKNNRFEFQEDSNQKETDEPNITEKFKFPLSTPADISEFNKEILNNSEYKNFLIKTYSRIGGTEGKEEGKIIAKKLLSIIFTQYVLTLYSWTGISRTPGLEKKQAFQSCEGILTFFHEVIQMADSRWNKFKNETFFKTHTLKHAKQINKAHEVKKNKEAVNKEAVSDAAGINDVGDTNNNDVLPTMEDETIAHNTTEVNSVSNSNLMTEEELDKN